MKIAQYNAKEKNTRDLSRTDLAHMVTNLRKELKAQIEENKELEKKIDGLITVIDSAKEYINHAQNYGTMAQVMPHLKPYVNGDDLLKILERVNEDE